MKKTLLFTAMATLALGASAQKAQLKDVTPKGYDFSQYEAGTQFVVQAPGDEDKNGYSPNVNIYDPAVMAKEGHFTTLLRRGELNGAPMNTKADRDKTAPAITIQDFGGYLGKCLVFNEAWSPLASNIPYFANQGKSAFPGPTSNFVGGNGSFGFGFFSDPTLHHHGYSGAAVRVRIVYTILRRGRHVTAKEQTDEGSEWGKDLMVGTYALEGNDGNYSPREDGNLTAKDIKFKGSEYCIWENEGDCQADMPAVHTPKSGVGVADPFDAAGQTNDLYTQQLQRFQVLEFDTYSVGEANPIIVCLNFVNANASLVIKEIKFFEIENPMELLGPAPDYTPNSGSYLFQRHISYRYYTEKGVKEIEEGYEYVPAGTKDNPHKITTAEEMAAISSKLVANTPVYFSLENDIDMSGITDYEPACGSDGKTYDKIIMFNGNNHVIKNLTVNGDYAYNSLFGVFQGEIRNLGVENCTIDSHTNGGGILGGYGGYGNYEKSIVDNVYVTGTVNSVSSYNGGMFGTTGNNIEISNSYVRADIKNIDIDMGGSAGIMVGRVNHPLTVTNCYASGSVEALDQAGGLLGFTKNGTSPLVKDCAVIDAKVDGDPGMDSDAIFPGTLAEGSKAMVANNVTVNGKAAEGTVPAADVIKAIQSWDAFHSTALSNNLPVLAWQAESGVIGIGEDSDADVDAAPVYYNLQGVQVAQPSNGLYIVKRGNKVTKEIIR